MTEWNPYVLPGVRVCRLTSAAGRDYQLMLAIPRRPPPPEGFPVVYAVDANALFGTMVEALRMSARRTDATGVPDAVVVGIGYPDAEIYDSARRTFDYTFGPPALEPDDRALTAGGGAAFLDFLESEVKPLVAAQVAVDALRQTLFGHSLGGLFALSVLTRRPQSFSTYLASSPSIWWDRQGFESAASRLRTDDAISAMLCVGQYEQALPPWMADHAKREEIAARRRQRAMIDNARDLAACLKNAGVRTEFHEFEGEDHASVPLRAINRGLRFALQPRNNPRNHP